MSNSRWLCVLALGLWLLTSQGRSQVEFEFDGKSGLDPAKVTLPSKQGSPLNVLGSTNVGGNMGSLSYSYPIPLPQWRDFWNGLFLEYSSLAGQSPYGYGFKLSIPAVRRSIRSGIPTGAQADFSSDLDGDLSSYQNGYYRARLENVGSARLYRFHDNTFEMSDGRGNTYLFGSQSNAISSLTSLSTEWWLSEVRDPFGNRVVFDYENSRGTVLPIRIQLTNQDGQVAYTIKMQYQDIKGSTAISMRSGIPQTNSRFLNQIEVLAASGKRISRIALTPEVDPSNQRVLLKTLEAFGISDVDVLPAWNFSYRPLASETSTASFMEMTVSSAAVPQLDAGDHKFIDFDSDGLPDLFARLSAQESSWTIFKKEAGTGFAIGIPADLGGIDLSPTYQTLLDINGDRKVDIISQRQVGNYYASLNTGTGFTPVRIEGLEAIDFESPGFTEWVDLNLDSKADLIRYDGAAVYSVFMNRSEGGRLEFKRQDQSFTFPREFIENRRWIDVNGDGVADLVSFDASLSLGGSRSTLNVALGDGQGGTLSGVLAMPMFYAAMAGVQIQFGDINGDGLLDIVLRNLDSIKILIHQVDGEGEHSFRETRSIDSYFKTDQGTTVQISALNQLNIGDANGNGTEDLIVTHGERSLVIAIDLYPEQQAYRPYLMTRTQTSLGSTQDFTYALNLKTNSLPMTYVSLSSKIDQGPTLGTAGLVTKVLTKEEYQHQTGRYDFMRNEFLGYRTFVKTVFADTGVLRRHVVEYENDNEVLRGLEKSNRTFAIIDGKDVLRSEVTSDNKQSELFNNIFLRFLKAKSIRTLEEGGEKTLLTRFCTEIYPDTKLTKSVLSVEFGPDNKEYRASEVVLAYSSFDNWQASLILVKSIFEYVEGVGRRVAAEANRYENFRLTQRDRWYNRQGESGWEPLGKLSYDAYGNVRSYSNAEGMLTEIDYSNGANVYPSLVKRTVNGYRGPISLINRYNYDLDAGGLLTGSTDENEQETSYAYDGAGRIKSQTLAGQSEPEVRWDYSYGSAQKFSTIHSYVRALGPNPASIKVLDGLMRTVASVSRTEKGFKLDAASIYDSFGKVVQTAENMPLASYTNPETLAIPATYLTRAFYDGLGRNIRNARPWATASSGFQTIQLLIDRRIMINEQGEVSVEVLDAFNRPCGSFQISKAGAAALARKLSCVGPIPTDGSVIGSLVSYDVRNQIVGLEFPSDKRSYEYDSFGRMRAVRSSLFGSYEFVFNRLDNPVARFHRDPAGKALGATFSQFDGMGRETARRSLENFSGDLVRDLAASALDYRFFYDESIGEDEHTNLKGRLAALEIQSFARYDYSYDPLGNQNQEVLQLYGKKLKTVMNHDPMGRLTRIAFPDESEINYEYASTSHLNPTGVKFYGESIQIQSNEVNIISEVSAVGRFQMTRSMDFVRQVVTGISSRGVTGDELQLKLSNLDGLSRPLELSGYFSKEINASVTYDDFGRLASVSSDSNRSDFARSLIYKYDASSRLIGASKDYAFDSAGRLTQSPLIKEVDWASDNRLVCVRSKEAASIGYSYQPDGQAFGVEEKGPNPRSLVYVNKFLEFDRLTGKFKKILWIGGERVAEALDTDSVIYFGRDHISTNRAQYAKSSTFDLVYDPWGRILTTPEDKKSFYGFADGRQETALGIVHFNARYYAPEIGAFVNPDEFMIFNPMTCFLSPLECNLYSYARNNPLRFRDPTGRYVDPRQMLSEQWLTAREFMDVNFRLAWTTVIEVPYLAAINFYAAKDIGTVSGRDISSLMSYNNFSLDKGGFSWENVQRSFIELKSTNASEKREAWASLGTAGALKWAGKASKLDAMNLENLGLITEKSASRFSKFGALMEKGGDIVEKGFKVNDAKGFWEDVEETMPNTSAERLDRSNGSE